MQEKTEQLGEDLREACEGSAALWFSGGSDSLLLLTVIARLGLKTHILRFDDGWSLAQKKHVMRMLHEHNAMAFSYPPRSAVLIGNGDELALGATYAIGRRGEAIPIVRDIVDGNVCSVDESIKLAFTPYPPIVFPKHILGSKATDKHFSFPNSPVPAKSWEYGGITMYAPLFDWTNEEVIEALRWAGIKYEQPDEALDSGNIAACTKCLRGEGKVFCPKDNEEIEAVKWSPEENLRSWQVAHGIEA